MAIYAIEDITKIFTHDGRFELISVSDYMERNPSVGRSRVMDMIKRGVLEIDRTEGGGKILIKVERMQLTQEVLNNQKKIMDMLNAISERFGIEY